MRNSRLPGGGESRSAATDRGLSRLWEMCEGVLDYRE